MATWNGRKHHTNDKGNLVVVAYPTMLMSEDFREGLDAFLDKRRFEWRGR